MPRLPGWLASVAVLAACTPSPQRLQVVHVAWPGRPVSDAMDREVFGDARLRATLARFDVARLTVDTAPAEVRAVLNGMGTLVRDGDRVVAIHAGAASAQRLIAFLERARTSWRDRGAHEATTPTERWEQASADLALGLPARAIGRLADLDPRVAGIDAAEFTTTVVAAHLALGDVAAARRLLDALPETQRPALAEARVRIAERRARDAIPLLENPAAWPTAAGAARDAHAFWLGRALLDCERRREAYAQLEPLAAGHGPFALDATELLGATLTGRDGHSHR